MYTTDDLWKITNQPENRDKRLELHDGYMVELSSSFVHSHITMKVATYIGNYLAQNPIGYVTGASAGYILSPHNKFIPNVAYISKARLPELPVTEVPIPPDLAVEVQASPDENLHPKAMKYLHMELRWCGQSSG